MRLLRAPHLVQRIVVDFHALGAVGEDINLRAANPAGADMFDSVQRF